MSITTSVACKPRRLRVSVTKWRYSRCVLMRTTIRSKSDDKHIHIITPPARTRYHRYNYGQASEAKQKQSQNKSVTRSSRLQCMIATLTSRNVISAGKNGMSSFVWLLFSSCRPCHRLWGKRKKEKIQHISGSRHGRGALHIITRANIVPYGSNDTNVQHTRDKKLQKQRYQNTNKL